MTQKQIFKSFLRALNIILTVFIFVATVLFAVLAGYYFGFQSGYQESEKQLAKILRENDKSLSSLEKELESIKQSSPQIVTKKVYVTPAPESAPQWSGPQLWDEVNRRRIELGVNPLSNEINLCTIASVRLNELLELGKLDAHEGFIKLSKREDYQHIFQKYNISEFLLSGARNPKEAVSMWENTQGHSKLLTGGEYVWGCVYAQNGFAVAIAAF